MVVACNMLVSALGQPEREFRALGEWEERGDGKHHPIHSGREVATWTLPPHTPVMHILPPLSTPVTSTHTHTSSLPRGPYPHRTVWITSSSCLGPCRDCVLPWFPGAHHTQDSTQTSGGPPKNAIRTMSHPTDVPTAPCLPTLTSYFLPGRQGALTPPPLRARAPAESTSICRKKHPWPWAERQLKVTWCPVNTHSNHTPTSAGILVTQGHNLRGHPKPLGVNPQKPSVIKANNILMQYLQKLNQQM